MTARPQRITLFLTFGALATALVGVVEYHADIMSGQFISRVEMAAIGVEVLLGTITVAGTVIAAGKLQEWVAPKPVTYRGQEVINGCMAAFIFGMLVYLIIYPPTPWVFYTMIALAFMFGVMLVMPVGSADVPLVVALLDSFSGLAACTTGFAIENGTLIVTGALVGASGFVLSIVMRETVNRSLSNVLFSAFGGDHAAKSDIKNV